MSEVRPGGDAEALPWLEGVEDEDDPPAISARKMLAALVMVLIGVGLVAGTLFWIGRQDAGSGPPQLIRAEPGPYKVRPDNPGGLDVSGESGTAYATGAGEDQDAQLDTSRLPDAPPAEAEEERSSPPPTEPSPTPPPAAQGKGTVIQLGAYGSTAKAETAWRLLSAKFPEVAGLAKMVVPYSGGYRLRAAAASPAEAQATCKAVTAGGESCFVAQ